MKQKIAFLVLILAAGVAAAQTTYTTVDAPVAIPDNTDSEDVCQTITVSGEGPVLDVLSVQVTADHSWVGDVTYELTAPAGPTVQFAMHRPGVVGQGGGGSGDSSNLCSSNPFGFAEANVTDPETAGSAEAGGACIGTAGPQDFFPNDDAGVTNFNAFEGADSNGVWTLCVGDYAGGDTGTLQSWSVTITSSPVELQTFRVDG